MHKVQLRTVVIDCGESNLTWQVGVLPGPDGGVLKKQGNYLEAPQTLSFLLLLRDNGHYWTQLAFKLDLWEGGSIFVVRDIPFEACRSFPTRTRIAIGFPIVWCFVLWLRGVRGGRLDEIILYLLSKSLSV